VNCTRVKLPFAAFPSVQRYLRFWTIRVIDLEYFPRWSREFNSGEFRRHISLVIKSKQLFHIMFYMRFSVMRFSTKVFDHAKTTRWCHCNADSLKTLKANYIIIRHLCVYRMSDFVGKILQWNSERLLRKRQKNLIGLLFDAPSRQRLTLIFNLQKATLMWLRNL